MAYVEGVAVGVPRVPADVISRPRLTAAIGDGAPLTLVRGATGSGKTVAVREWATTSREPLVWITAGAPVETSTELALAVTSGIGRLTGAELCPMDADEWARARAALQLLDGPLTIVVDDAAALDPEAMLDLCNALVDSPRLRVIVAANRRTVMDGKGVGLLVDRSVIGPADLMFDHDELSRTLNIDGNTAADIRDLTNGFPAVIHALARRGMPAAKRTVLDASVEAVEEYMRIRVARSGYDPGLLRTLILMSVADTLDVSLARSLSGDVHAERALDDAEHYGFGSWESGASGQLFRFAPFARALLRRELERVHPDELPRLRETVVEWSVRNEEPINALRHAVAGDDLALASRVVKLSWHHLISHNGRAVCEILGPVPLSHLRQHTLLVMILAICYISSRVRRLRGLHLLRVAVSAANSQRPDVSPSDRLFIWTAESVALRLIGMPDRATAVARRAVRVLAELSDEETEGYARELPLLCAQLGVSLYYGGERDEAIDSFEQGAALAEAGVRAHAISSLAMLSGIHALSGDIPEARGYAEIIRSREWTPGHLDGYQGTFYRIAEAIIALEEEDLSRAAEHIAVFEPHRATSEHWVAMATTEALVALCSQQAMAGLTRLESFARLRGREGHSATARRGLTRSRVLLHLALGSTQEAQAILRKDPPEDHFETIVARAHIALIEGRPADTLRMLAQTGLPPTTARLTAAATALRAAALLRVGGESAARSEAAALAAVLVDRELRLPLALLPPEDLLALRNLFSPEASALLSVESVLSEPDRIPTLTPRERVILHALVTQASVPAIASELFVSPNTVKSQIKSLYRKLGVTSRDEAVAAAVARRLLADGSPY